MSPSNVEDLALDFQRSFNNHGASQAANDTQTGASSTKQTMSEQHQQSSKDVSYYDALVKTLDRRTVARLLSSAATNNVEVAKTVEHEAKLVQEEAERHDKATVYLTQEFSGLASSIWKDWVPGYDSIDNTKLENKVFVVNHCLEQLSETMQETCKSKGLGYKIKCMHTMCGVGEAICTSKNEILVQINEEATIFFDLHSTLEAIVQSVPLASRITLSKREGDAGREWCKSIERMSKLKDLLPTKKESHEELERIINLAKGIERSPDSYESSVESESESDLDTEEEEEEIARLEAEIALGPPVLQFFQEEP